VLHILSVLNLT